MSKAVAKVGETVVADSDNTVVVEGNHYFPMSDVNKDFLKKSDTHTVCHWKGTADYYNVEVEGQTYEDAAFEYPEPSEAAKDIKDHVAFWREVEVEDK